MPISIIIIDKTGVIKASSLKEFKEDELYKKAGYKNGDGFSLQTTWPVQIKEQKYSVSVFGKTAGRAGQENKYDFPPPIDNTLFFGSCVLVNKSESGDAIDLTAKDWEAIYEHLFGGFEDLGSEEASDDEDDEDADLPHTKEGYAKDGFIVDDDEDEDDDDEEEEDDEDEDEDESDGSDDDSFAAKKKAKAKKAKAAKQKDIKAKIAKTLAKAKTEIKKSKTTKAVANTAISQNVFVNVTGDANSTFMDCTSELVEESYL